jgi:hypothetical protein
MEVDVEAKKKPCATTRLVDHVDEEKTQSAQSHAVHRMSKRQAKTYNSGYSLVVTHLTTNPPVRCLNRAERTGSLVFNVLWSYVKDWTN